MKRKPYKRHKNLELMLKYLTKDDRKNYKDYIFGYKKAKDIIEETGLPRHTFYIAVNKIDPNIKEHKNSRKLTALNIVYQQVKRSIPFEYIEFDVEKLFGRNNKFDEYSLTKKRNAVINKLNANEFDLKDAYFMTMKRMKTWYKRYCIKQDLIKNEETGYKIAKKYQIATSLVFNIKNELNETTPLLKSIDLKQENIMLQNIEIYEKYKQGSTPRELSEAYNLNVWLIKVITKYVKDMINEVTNT